VNIKEALAGVFWIIPIIAISYLLYLLLERSFKNKPKQRKRYILILWAAASLLALTVTIRLGSADLVGILITAGIAISSTTFIANAMAGIMLGFIHDFEIGDAIQVGDSFGLVVEKRAFHLQIQTEDSDIIVLPNLQLINKPVKIMRSSGTIISAKVSLGYDISRKKIKKALIEAAEKTGLENPFVQVLELGDFAVTYRVGGLLKDVSSFITARSELREEMLDSLHKQKIEIVSPTFMNTRAVAENKLFIPKSDRKKDIDHVRPEDIAFTEVKKAQEIEDLQEKSETLQAEIAKKKKQLAKIEKEDEGLNTDTLKDEIENMERDLEATRIRLAEGEH